MPKLTPQQVKTYGVTQANNLKSFREKLMDKFAAHDYVRVINCDSEPVRWQYMPATAENVTFTADPMKITTRGDVEVYLLNPGESEVLLGENAYLMIETLYKQVVAKKVTSKGEVAPGVARSFNFSDPLLQDEWIDKILIGKETPNFSHFEVEEDEAEPTAPHVKEVKPSGTATERKLKQHLSEQTA